MTVQFFVLPIVTLTDEYGTHRGPAYLKSRAVPNGLVVPQWSMKTYGALNVGVVAVNADQIDLDWLAAQPNAHALPEDLDLVPTVAERNAVISFLESNYIPAHWITPTDSYRAILRTVLGLALYMQRLHVFAPGNPFTDWGYTFDTQWGDIAYGRQAGMIQAAQSMGYDTSAVQNTTPLRAVLKYLADAWGDTPVLFGFVQL